MWILNMWGEEVSVRSFYWFIHDQRKKFHVNRMCSSLSVNERGYYKWLNNGERPKKWQSLLAEIHRILDENPDKARMESFFATLKKEKLYSCLNLGYF
ncbi:MAG: hypothetical protein II367_03185 [Treponema sp.]|nr:hypothetical protein [Treponema sp.]